MNPETVAATLADPVASYLAARAVSEVLAERVARIGAALLAEMVILDDDGNRISDPADVWMCRDQDSHSYYAELERRTNKAIPHDLPSGHCPSLAAASKMRNAENNLILAMGPIFGFDGSKVYNLDLRRKMIKNGVGLVLAVDRVSAA